ncbi:hypothetical protein [Dactylosporangium sp. NPDC051484]
MTSRTPDRWPGGRVTGRPAIGATAIGRRSATPLRAALRRA